MKMTIELTPEQAERLQEAVRNGQFAAFGEIHLGDRWELLEDHREGSLPRLSESHSAVSPNRANSLSLIGDKSDSEINDTGLLDPADEVLQEHLNRWRAGDRAAMEELLRVVIGRLAKLARRMLRSFPSIRGHTDADDVLQNSLMRLLRTLLQIKPTTTRDFFNLAAVHIRRELLDIARSTRGKGTVPLNAALPDPSNSTEPTTSDSLDVEQWVIFHQAVDRLPLEEREVLSLVFYHGWTQQRIAELFQVDERTIRRRWSAACARLKSMVGMNFLQN